MGRKGKYTYEEKLQACEEYLSGKKSAAEIAARLQMGKRGNVRVLEWARKYQSYGPEILQEAKTNRNYSREFKLQVVNEYLSGTESLEVGS